MQIMITHLINQYGDRIAVETRNLEKEIQQLNESTGSSYQLDIDWYLNNGYSIAEDMFRRIEGNGSNK